MAIDIKKIQKLIALIDKTSITEIEIKEGEDAVRLSRQGLVSGPVSVTKTLAVPSVTSSTELEPQPIVDTPQSASQPAIKGHVVHSPMVGTMYAGRDPNAPPFVTVGQSVKLGDPLCLIEAMKMFNEIEADKAGKIVQILVSNGEPVEYDQPLFVIE